MNQSRPKRPRAETSPDRRTADAREGTARAAHGAGSDHATAGTNEGTIGTDTREALIRAARERFARGGFDGASIREITRLADANLGAVTYHFGSKRALYTEVLRRVVEPLQARVDAALSTAAPPLERLEALVRAFFEQLRNNPDQPFLILQEIAAGKAPPPPVSETMVRTLTRVVDVIVEGQDDGSIRPGDPVLMFLSLLSQPVYMSLAGRAMPGGVGRRLRDKGRQQQMIDHAVTFVRRGLESPRGRVSNGTAARPTSTYDAPEHDPSGEEPLT